MDFELWDHVFASLKNFREIFADLVGSVSSKGTHDVKALVTILLEATMSYLEKHHTSYLRFMSTDYQHLAPAHRERNWPGMGAAWRDLLYLRQLLVTAIEPLNHYAKGGEAIDWSINDWRANLPEPRSVVPETAPFVIREKRPYRLQESDSYFDEALVRTVFWSSRYSYQYVDMTIFGTNGLPLLLLPLRERWSDQVGIGYEENGIIKSLTSLIKAEKN